MKNIKLITTNISTVPVTIEMNFQNGSVLFIGKVIGFNEFFCYADSEESCMTTLTASFEIYLDMLLKNDLENLGITFGDGEKE